MSPAGVGSIPLPSSMSRHSASNARRLAGSSLPMQASAAETQPRVAWAVQLPDREDGMRYAGLLIVGGLMVSVCGSCRSTRTASAEETLDGVDAGAPVGAGALAFWRVFRPTGEGDTASVMVGAVAVGHGGDIWIAGNFTGVLQVGDTTLHGASGFVTRLGPTGNPRWSTSLGHSWVTGLALDVEGAAIVGCPPSTGNHVVSLVKLDADGRQLWHKEPFSITASDYKSLDDTAADGAGGILLLGTTMDGILRAGPSTVHGGYASTFLIRVGGDGEAQWATRTGIASQEERFRLAVDGAGNAFIGQGNADGKNIFLAKVDHSGAVLWGSWLPGGNVQFSGVGMDAQGNILLSGSGRLVVRGLGAVDEPGRAWIAKLAPTRAPLWHALGAAERLMADSDGNVLVANDRFAGKLSASGAWLWKWSPQTIGDAHIRGAAVDSAGRLIIAGSFQGSVDFGGGPVQTGAGGALFVAGLAP
jgi:hypothetical protein